VATAENPGDGPGDDEPFSFLPDPLGMKNLAAADAGGVGFRPAIEILLKPLPESSMHNSMNDEVFGGMKDGEAKLC